MTFQHLYIYKSSNSTVKYGVFNNNRYERIIDGQTYYSNKIELLALFKIVKLPNYKYYNYLDNIISRLCRNNNILHKFENTLNIKFEYLIELTNGIINNYGGEEHCLIEYLDCLINTILIDYPKFNLDVYKYNNEELEEIKLQLSSYSKNLYITKNNELLKEENNFNLHVEDSNLKDENKTNFQLRDYQQNIIQYCTEKLKLNNKIYLELATGGGKSYIVFNLIKNINPDIIICFSPRKKINEQNMSSKYANILNYKYNYFNHSLDTNIDKFMNDYKYKFIVCCVQSQARLYDKIKTYNLNNCFIWFDEAHWGLEDSWLEKNDDSINFWFNNNNSIRYRFYSSASSNYKIVQKHKNIFGELYKPISIKELIKQKWLCPIKAYIFEHNEKDNINLVDYILKNFKKYNKNWGFSFHNRDKNAYNLFKLHYTLYNDKHTSIKPFLLIDITKLTNELQNIPNEYLCESVFENTHKSIAYVVKKYDMGYDFPKLDYIIFSDPKLSSKDIIQCIGRGTRSDKLGVNGCNLNKYLNIMLPLYVENEDNTTYEKIINVLRYLIHDLGLNVIYSIIEKNKSNIDTDDDKETQDVNYSGSDLIAAKLLDLLDFSKNFKKTEYVYEICIKNNIKNEIDYSKFIENNKHIKLSQNIYDYVGFKWKNIVDPNNEYYYSTIEECNNAVNHLLEKLYIELGEEEYEELCEIFTEDGWLEYHKYDKKIPPYNKLEQYYY